MQLDSVGISHFLLHDPDQPADVLSAGTAQVDNEIGMQFRNLCTPDPVAFQVQPLDQPSRLGGFRIAEHTAAAWLFVGLSARAVTEVAAGASLQLRRIMTLFNFYVFLSQVNLRLAPL